MSRAVGVAGQLRALALANARFWPGVAPATWRELASWRAAAETIADERLRTLALSKLEHESFNAEVAATLATLAPARERNRAVAAIVALEVLFDYLDGRTEDPGGWDDDREGGARGAGAEARRMSGALTAAVPGQAPWTPGPGDGDGRYLAALSAEAAAQAGGLPSVGAVAQTMLAAAGRCAQGQLQLHAAASTGDEERLRDWAVDAAGGSGLGWREYAGGCASSVLAMHALIASAARADIRAEQAAALDRAYLAIGALITMLDSIADEAADRARGEAGYIRLFAPQERPGRARTLARLSLERIAEAPDRDHHAMTLAGVVAYYTTHPGARTPHGRAAGAELRAELGPALAPTLAVMGAWRAAKSARRALTRGSGRLRGGPGEAAHPGGRAS